MEIEQPLKNIAMQVALGAITVNMKKHMYILRMDTILTCTFKF